mmetsp:Transcript_133725/g.245194  ORF Transcript_133725/g.245194 Transcript_133725/m.245194 type:complete len:85 (-) Transcript_133725:44-298(-)
MAPAPWDLGTFKLPADWLGPMASADLATFKLAADLVGPRISSARDLGAEVFDAPILSEGIRFCDCGALWVLCMCAEPWASGRVL